MESQEQQQQQPAPALAEAVTTANALLISSLAAGSAPCEDNHQLKEQIAAYRASIEALSKQLEQLGDAADTSDEQQQEQHAADQEAPSNIPGIGQEGVDYTVGVHESLMHPGLLRTVNQTVMTATAAHGHSADWQHRAIPLLQHLEAAAMKVYVLSPDPGITSSSCVD